MTHLCSFASPTTTGSFQWCFPLALQIPPGLILPIGLHFVLADSPRCLIWDRRDDEAREAFRRIRGELKGEELTREFEDMKEQILFAKVRLLVALEMD
ncbi:hypothetical protein V5O48_019168 [Marasmius crinis-equi]|uniref:Uncharacterized protein n=1 Tax=Marasmius crinis-equi TaxID=585013 RepID=A0ABR3EJ87_9AGAR